MKALHVIAMILLVIGGLNWGLIGLFGFDLVAAIFGAGEIITRILYVLVGVSALYKISCFCKTHECGPSCGPSCKK